MGTTSPGYELSISDVVHKTHIELDRNGTKAAAATGVIMRATSSPRLDNDWIDIYLDRPFIYAIVDTESNVPVFLGVVNDVD